MGRGGLSCAEQNKRAIFFDFSEDYLLLTGGAGICEDDVVKLLREGEAEQLGLFTSTTTFFRISTRPHASTQFSEFAFAETDMQEITVEFFSARGGRHSDLFERTPEYNGVRGKKITFLAPKEHSLYSQRTLFTSKSSLHNRVVQKLHIDTVRLNTTSSCRQTSVLLRTHAYKRNLRILK